MPQNRLSVRLNTVSDGLFSSLGYRFTSGAYRAPLYKLAQIESAEHSSVGKPYIRNVHKEVREHGIVTNDPGVNRI